MLAWKMLILIEWKNGNKAFKFNESGKKLLDEVIPCKLETTRAKAWSASAMCLYVIFKWIKQTGLVQTAVDKFVSEHRETIRAASYNLSNRVLKPLRHVSMGAKYSVLNKRTPVFKMASLTIASLLSFFAEEKKSIERGENHYKSDHIESVTYNQGVLRGEVHASMKKKVYKVTVSESRIRLIDRE